MMPSLNFKLQQQTESHWCWLAVVSSVSRFYTPGSPFSQSKLMEHFIRAPHYGQRVLALAKERRTNPEQKVTNFPGKIEEGLRMVQCFRERLDLKVKGSYDELLQQANTIFPRIKTEVDNGRPVVGGVKPRGSAGEGHAVVVIGYSDIGEIYWVEPGKPDVSRTSPNFSDFMWNAAGIAYVNHLLFTKPPTQDMNDPRFTLRY